MANVALPMAWKQLEAAAEQQSSRAPGPGSIPQALLETNQARRQLWRQCEGLLRDHTSQIPSHKLAPLVERIRSHLSIVYPSMSTVEKVLGAGRAIAATIWMLLGFGLVSLLAPVRWVVMLRLTVLCLCYSMSTAAAHHHAVTCLVATRSETSNAAALLL